MLNFSTIFERITNDFFVLQKWFMALENIMMSPIPSAAQNKNADNVAFNVDETTGTMCEPIRKLGRVISPVKNYPSSPTVSSNQFNLICEIPVTLRIISNHSNTRQFHFFADSSLASACHEIPSKSFQYLQLWSMFQSTKSISDVLCSCCIR